MSIPGKILIALLSALIVSAAASALQPELALLDLLLPAAIAAVLAVVLSHRALPVPEALESEPARGEKQPAEPAREDRADRKRGNDRNRKGPKEARKTTEAPARPRVPAGGDFENGTVKWFNVTKGYGFIIRSSGEEIFVHHRSVLGEGRGRLEDGAKVRFRVVDTDKGPQAEDVEAL
jgi:cold shock CspA family protein